MDWMLNGDQKKLLQSTKEFALEELQGDLQVRDRESSFNRANWEKCAQRGVLGSNVGAEWGGQGQGALETVLMMEGVGYGSRDNGLTLALGGQIWSIQDPIEIFGSTEQKQKYLPKLVSGEWLGADGITEETSGSDALSLQTRADKVEGGYLLNGRKAYIGMAPESDVVLVLAKTNPELGSWGISVFVVERGTKGFSQSEPRVKMGTRTSPLGDLIFENCFVADEQRLGEEGVGMSLFSRSIIWERAFIHAGHLGAMERTIEACIEYAKNRIQFGQPIGSFQAVSHRIAEMKVRQETSRLLLYQIAKQKDLGEVDEMACSIAKLHMAESLLTSSMDAIRVHGARGYLEDFGIERELRDHAGGVIYAGTSDIQKNIIAKLLGI